MPHKIQVIFDDQAMKFIEDASSSTGQSKSEVLREALRFYAWAKLQAEKGYSVGTVQDGRAVREVVLPFQMLPKETK